ncbi:hypothetical protein M0638_25000 [Roseomonas sp. NAR14]|uniref:SlyX protein n=1 Tax=Roseomonas acroporae TaxID=2937791 RepID=A0A9X1YBY0_9PROT|nr:hypothetical protein [Roseomonas acroporae]MCK8787629.1 hypothetical protein [Roseomonas acroporae]
MSTDLILAEIQAIRADLAATRQSLETILEIYRRMEARLDRMDKRLAAAENGPTPAGE